MTPIKFISAGLIAAALLATPAMAHQNYAARHYVTGNAHSSASPAFGHFDSHARLSEPRAGAIAAPPDGENCDVGDNPFIC